MRGLVLIGMLSIPLCVALLFLIQGARAEPSWTIQEHVTVEGQDLVLDRNISIADGGWFELLGSSIRFNCTYPLEYAIHVNPGGRLTIGASSGGIRPRIGPVDARYPTSIEAAWSESVDIQDLSMQNCGSGALPAVLIDHVNGLIVRNCEFHDCDMTLSVRSCADALVDGNRIVGARVRAMEFGSVLNGTVQYNHIDGCNVGIEIQYSTCILLRGNDLASVSMTGLNLMMVDDVRMQANSIAMKSGWAIEVHMSKLLRIEDQTIQGPDPAQGIVSGILLKASSLVRVQDCTLHGLGEAVRIHAYFGDRSESNILTRLNISECDTAVNISSVANWIIGCAIERCPIGVSINPVYGDASRDNRIDGCSLVDCGTGVLLIGTRTTMIERTLFSGCSAGISGVNTMDDLASNCSLMECKETAVEITDGELGIWNCTIEGGPLAIFLSSYGKALVHQSSIHPIERTAHLDDRSILELHNSTHLRTYDIDQGSMMTVGWDVEVSVRLESGDRNIDPGSLLVRDAMGEVETNSHISEIPWGLTTELRESRVFMGERTVFTPHLFIATVPIGARTVEQVIDRFTRLDVCIDDVPPRINIQTPIQESSRDVHVALSGFCLDNSSADVGIVISLDGEHLFSGTNRWEMGVDLRDGLHALDYTATDDSGNTARRRQSLLVDSTPPRIMMISPPINPYLIADDEIVISGILANGTGISLDGIAQSLKDGSFQSILELPEDGEYTCKMRAWDELGNNISLALTIVRDMTAPVVQLDDYPNVTRETSMVLGGWTARDVVSVRLDEREVPLLPGVRFTLFLNLTEGMNEHTVTASDAAGNRGTERVVVTLDTHASFEVVWPMNGTIVQMSEISVVIRGETGAKYRIDSSDWVDADGNGYCTIQVSLFQAENHVCVSMEDRAGNLEDDNVTVIYSPRVFYHESHAMAWAFAMLSVVVLGSVGLSLLHLRYAHAKR